MIRRNFRRLFGLPKNYVLLINKKKALTPSKRHYKCLKISKNLIRKKVSFLKNQLSIFKQKKGRAFGSGKILCRFRSQSTKKRYRLVSNSRIPFIHKGIIEHFEYNPILKKTLMRVYNPELNYHFYSYKSLGVKAGFFINSFIAPLYRFFFVRNLIHLVTAKTSSVKNLFFQNQYNRLRFILYPNRLEIGDKVSLYHLIPLVPLNNLTFDGKNKISSSLGNFCMIIQKYYNYALMQYPSKKRLFISSKAEAVIGRLENVDHKHTSIGKAGRKRLFGFRPRVRGVAMNPVDHPHGGGEGKTSGGQQTSLSLWGKPTKHIKKVKKSDKQRKNKIFV